MRNKCHEISLVKVKFQQFKWFSQANLLNLGERLFRPKRGQFKFCVH